MIYNFVSNCFYYYFWFCWSFKGKWFNKSRFYISGDLAGMDICYEVIFNNCYFSSIRNEVRLTAGQNFTKFPRVNLTLNGYWRLVTDHLKQSIKVLVLSKLCGRKLLQITDHITSNFLRAVFHNLTWSVLKYFLTFVFHTTWSDTQFFHEHILKILSLIGLDINESSHFPALSGNSLFQNFGKLLGKWL